MNLSLKDPVCASTSTVHNTSDLNVNDRSLELVISHDNETKNPTFSSVSVKVYYITH